MDVEIRRAVAADVESVLPMVGKHYALHEEWEPAKYGVGGDLIDKYRWWLNREVGDGRGVFLVADRGEKIVAFLIGTVEKEIPIYRVAEFGFIHDVWVEAEYRHEGIGRSITMAAVEAFKNLGVGQVRLDTARANDPARGLFTACGFRVSTIEMLLEL